MAVELPIVAAILIGGAAIAKIAEQYRFPYPIPLILAGLLLAQWIPGEELLAGIGIDFIAQLTLATVLFYAGLNMNIRELRTSIRSIMMLATLGVFLTAIIAGVTINYLIPAIGVFTALLIGAILSPTDPAALFSVLESGGVKVKRKIFSILEGEAVFNDATAVILVITLFLPFVVPTESINLFIVAFQFLASMGLGVVIGFAVAYVMGLLLLSPVGETNVSVLTATTPILAYGIGELFAGAGIHPGALAAVFAGIFMANTRRIGLRSSLPQKSMRGVMKNVSFAFEIVIFTLLGLTLNTEYMMTHPNTTLAGLVVAALVIFVARPASVFLVTSPDRSMNWKDRFFVSWAGVKGVASAALAAIAVAVILAAPATPVFLPDILAEEINAIVFIVLMFSLIVQGITTPFLASRLDLVEEKDAARAITAQRDATRHTLLLLVDEYTEGKVDNSLYTRLKSELEEEIFTLEDELRIVISERRAQLRELEVREKLFQSKLDYFQDLYEKGDISNTTFEDQKTEIELELSEIEGMKRYWRTGKESQSAAN
ncbi:MAG: cation:proton antiporter [Candidatus Thorarchaeota archaeon]